ncbi:hypothetical protein A0H76_2788 [Hepatospora eriocheir]|uniref:Uncharacterized protein n=1 Tax=Hepatospora eriocheir TaxID=1081669 RepID=A0A1X0QET1_9MICR|nr:hypothetical protein A0H76_2788 [Hepatospora eriocheir]
MTVDLGYLARNLLENGIIETNEDVNIHDLNDLLVPLQFYAIKWPDYNNENKQFNTIVLKNCANNKNNLIHPWKESTTKEAIKVIEAIANDTFVNSYLIDDLIEQKYVIKNDKEYSLGLRTLINYEDYLIELNPKKYKKCRGCLLIVEHANKHKNCF